MQSRERVHASKSKLNHPQLVRVCFESLAPVHLLLSLIRSNESAAADKASLRSDEFQEGRSYCLVDACIDDEMRCATIFQIWPKHRVILGGIYLARNLEIGTGVAYLEFLRNPKLASGSDISLHRPGRAADSNHHQQSIDAALAMLLLSDGSVLRSATLQDLTHLTAEQNYVRVHLVNGENVVVRGPLQKYEEVLPEDFIRASRHVIVNVRKVQRLKRVSRDLGIVYFAGEGEQTIRLGRKASIIMRTALLTRSGLPMGRGNITPDAPTD